MPDEEARVGHQRAVEQVEVLGRGTPVPRHALLQALQRHPLHPRQHPHQVIGVGAVDTGRTRRQQRGDRESAIATNHGGHPMQRRRAQRGVPERLRVVVGVDVDEPRRHHQTGRVDGVRCRRCRGISRLADRDDPAVTHTDGRHHPRCPGTVDHQATDDLQVEQASVADAGVHFRPRLRTSCRGIRSAPAGEVRRWRAVWRSCRRHRAPRNSTNWWPCHGRR